MSEGFKTMVNNLREHLYQYRNCNIETVHMLECLATKLDEEFEIITKAKYIGSATSIAGGILAAVGFGLSFVTFGASLGLSIAGTVISGVGGAAVGGSNMRDASLTKENLESAQAVLDKYNKVLNTLKEECIQIGEQLQQKDEKMKKYQYWITFWRNLFFGIGSTTVGVSWNLIANTIKLSFEAAFPTQRTAAQNTMHIVGGVAGIAFIAVDVYTLITSARDLQKTEPHAVSKYMREIADKLTRSRPTTTEIENLIANALQ